MMGVTTAPLLRRTLQALALLCAVAVHAQAPLHLARIENMPDQALGSELLRVVYGRLGIAVEFVDLPARRALLESSAGRLDGEVQRIADVHNEFPSLIVVGPALNVIEPSAFAKRADIVVDGWESLRFYAVGIVRGVGSSERGTRGMAQVQALGGMEPMMTMLASDRLDLAVCDRFSGVLISQRLGLGEVVRPLAPALQRIPVHHLLHERHRELAARIAGELARMEGSGELARLREEIMQRMLREVRR
jgi:polar amino acid transport system substrate-binding protein